MARKPKQRRIRARNTAKRFDASQLTADDRQLLAAFEQRRAQWDRFLVESNILYHKHTCPACGLPTLDELGDHEVCAVCLWQEGFGENDVTAVGYLNPVSLLQARLEAAMMLAEFERTHALPGSPDDIVRSIRDFTRRWNRGEVGLDRADFTANLLKILPATRRT